jgi:hypothetical protein
MKSFKEKFGRIFLKGFSRSEKGVMEFLKNLETDSKFFRTS